jgi:glucosylceramidase
MREIYGLAVPPFVVIASLVLVACPGSNESTQTVSRGSEVQIVETTGDKSMLLQAQPSASFASGGDTSSLVITVNAATQFQEMDGVGGSLTDSSAWLIWNKLNPSQQTMLMQQLFSPANGIGISFLRQPMGATDFSASGDYSYDDMPAGQTDPNLASFSIAHDASCIIPLLRQALSVNPGIKVVALPWSPPAWMKTSGTMNGGNVDPSYFPSLSQYFVKYVQAYQQAGIPIYAVSAQNEPQYSTPDYPSVNLPAADESVFIANYLGPALSDAGLRSVKIFAYEHNWDNPGYAESVLGSSAGQYVAGSSFHCYAGDPSAQSTVKTAFPGKDLWFTECSGITSTKFADDLVWNAEHLLIGATRNWARSVSLWNLALDQNSGPKNGTCTNCRGVVTIDDSVSPATVSFNVEYYILGHLGKFVAPSAHRIDSNTFGPGSVEDVAFQNPDGSLVLLVLNSGNTSSTFTVSSKGQTFNYTLPAGALATFTWK